MKKTLSIMITAFVIGCLFACVPNPKESAVINKAESSVVNTNDTIYSTDENDKKNNVQVVFSCEPMQPTVDRIAFYNLKATAFTDQQLQPLVIALFGNTELYEITSRTKEEIKEELLVALEELQRVKENPEKYEASESVYQMYVDELQQEYDLAPSADNLVPTDVALKQNENGDTYFNCQGKCGKQQFAKLIVLNQTDDPDDVNSFLYFVNGGKYISWTLASHSDVSLLKPETDISQSTAINIATELINSIGIRDMQYAGCDIGVLIDELTQKPKDVKGESAPWLVFFTRVQDNVQVTLDARAATNCSGESYAPSMYYEKVIVAVDKDGIPYFEWKGPTTIISKTDGQESLLSYDTIKKYACNYLSYKYPVLPALYNTELENQAQLMDDNQKGRIIGCRIVVERVEFGWMQVATDNTNRNSRLIPVWDFYGTIEREYESGLTEVYDGMLESLITINACNGSIIDRDFGH